MVQSQEDYLKMYESLTKHYETTSAELEQLQNLCALRSQKDKSMSLYIRTLKKQPVMVEKTIVHRNGEMTFVFYNGIKVRIEE